MKNAPIRRAPLWAALLLGNCCVLPALAQPAFHEFYFVRQATPTAPFIAGDAGDYEYQPSPIRNADGTLDVWYCSGTRGSKLPWGQGDGVSVARFNALNQQLGPATVAVDHTNQLGVPDGRHACDVSVVKHHYPGLSWPGGSIDQAGEELYLMYYECAPNVTDRARPSITVFGGPNEICLAASVDGVTWMRHNNALQGGIDFGNIDTPASPVVERDPAVDTLCNLSETDPSFPGQYVADFDDPADPNDAVACSDWLNAYGSGHPSAISMPAADATRRAAGLRDIWLYYYDSRGQWGLHGAYLRISEDGINFGSPINLPEINPDTELPVANKRLPGGKVRYFDVNVDNNSRNYGTTPMSFPGVFIATYNTGGNHFSYSFDGVGWYNSTQTWPPRADMQLAAAVSDPEDLSRTTCVAPGSPTIVSDKYGWVKSLTGVEILSGEGQMGAYDGCTSSSSGGDCAYCYSAVETANRGITWNTYWLKGDFGHIAKPSVDVCSIYEERNVRDHDERGESGTVGTTPVFVDQGDYFTYADVADFLAKNGNDGRAYFNVNNETYDSVEACGYGGARAAMTANDVATVTAGGSVNISVLTNDPGGGLVATTVVLTQPQHGTATVNSSGVVTYTHANDGSTSDVFTYTVETNTGLLSSPAFVNVLVGSAQVLYRINAGGPGMLSGNWAEDRAWASGVPSPRVNAVATGDTTFATATAINITAVPLPQPPMALFQDDRYDVPTGQNMKWEFPVNANQPVEVRLYFSENYRNAAGIRIFDVKAEGVLQIDDLDIFAAAAGQYKAIRRSFTITPTDGMLDLEFVPQSGDSPLVNGIEILGAPVIGMPAAVNDTSKVGRGWKTAVKVLGNDTGAFDLSSVTVVQNPTNGSVAVDTASGVITYTHNGGVSNSDTFRYTARDVRGRITNVAKVDITVSNPAVLYRINAGGAAVVSGTWAADLGASSYVNNAQIGYHGYNVAPRAIGTTGITSPPPQQVFQDHRWDDAAALPEMEWYFPIAAGAGPEIEIKLYFAETWYNTANSREFDILVEGLPWLQDLDVWTEAGGQDKALQKTVRRSTDGTLNLSFVTKISNPLISGIEIYGPN